MKKTLLSLLMAMTAITSSAQTIGEAFYIYRNDGGFNAFFRDEVDSIVYSNYDADSIWYDDVVSQVVYTPDSTYFIPLAAIDSVGFVTPETVYSEDVKVLTGDLFDYVTSVDGLSITLSSNTPASLLPKSGDKIATVNLTDKFPWGFCGLISEVTSISDGYMIKCDTLSLSDVMDRFYGVANITDGNDAEVQSMRKTASNSKQFTLDLSPINMPVSLSRFITEKKIFDIEGAANLGFNVKPHLWGKLTYVIDKSLLLSCVNLHTVTTLECEIDIDVAGVATKDFKTNLLPKEDYYPWGIPIYVELGPKFEMSGEFAVGARMNTTVICKQDIVYHPVISALPVVGFLTNSITQDVQRGPVDFEWQYIAGRGSIAGGCYLRLGISLGKHEFGWVGGEFDGPLKADIDFFFDINRLKQDNKSTLLYDELKDLCKLDITPYVGAKFVASVKDDKLRFEKGKDFEKTDKWFSGRILPAFSNFEAVRLQGQHGNAELSSAISKSCPIPFTVGYTLIDKNNQSVNSYYDEKYSMFNQFPSYSVIMDNLYGAKKYKCYPTIKLFGFDLLASPECELWPSIKVTTLKADNVTNTGVQLSGYIGDINPSLDDGEYGFYYSPSDNPSNSTQIRVGEASDFFDGEFHAELTELEENVTYDYSAYYYSDDEYLFGEPESFTTQENSILCPDENHPHAIDLGLPSGTKWACCNVGASSPEEFGDYYSWGETSVKTSYLWNNYKYWSDKNGDGHWRWNNDELQNIDFDISGTLYDVAHVKWGGNWCIPSKEQIQELLDNCTSTMTSINSVDGREFTGPNNSKVFLPSAELIGWESILTEDSGQYWSSTRYPDYYNYAYTLSFWPEGVELSFGFNGVFDGQSVRPVSK